MDEGRRRNVTLIFKPSSTSNIHSMQDGEAGNNDDNEDDNIADDDDEEDDDDEDDDDEEDNGEDRDEDEDEDDVGRTTVSSVANT